MKDFLDSLYTGYYPIKSLPKYKHGNFRNGKPVLVAIVKSQGDGQTVKVYEQRIPARFFTLKVLSCNNSVGELKEGYEIGTGSGGEMGELAGQIANNIANGMLAFRRDK